MCCCQHSYSLSGNRFPATLLPWEPEKWKMYSVAGRGYGTKRSSILSFILGCSTDWHECCPTFQLSVNQRPEPQLVSLDQLFTLTWFQFIHISRHFHAATFSEMWQWCRPVNKQGSKCSLHSCRSGVWQNVWDTSWLWAEGPPNTALWLQSGLFNALLHFLFFIWGFSFPFFDDEIQTGNVRLVPKWN